MNNISKTTIWVIAGLGLLLIAIGTGINYYIDKKIEKAERTVQTAKQVVDTVETITKLDTGKMVSEMNQSEFKAFLKETKNSFDEKHNKGETDGSN